MSRELAGSSKNMEGFQLLQQPDLTSGHATVIATKRGKHKQFCVDGNGWDEVGDDRLWLIKYFKKNPDKLSLCEAGVAALYRLIAPDLIPKIRALYRQKTPESPPEFFATASKLFSNFMPLKNYLGNNFGVRGHEADTKEKLDALLENGLAEVLTLSYFFEEDDLHKDNIGILFERADAKIIVKKVVRVDFDMSLFSIIGEEKFHGDRVDVAEYVSSYGKKTKKPVSERFPITTHNINYFPFLNESDVQGPYYWLTTFQVTLAAHAYTVCENQEFQKLSNNAKCNERSYLSFLKIILIPNHVFKNTLAKHIPDPELADMFYHHIAERKKKLCEILKNSENFKRTLRKVFERVKEERTKEGASKKSHLSPVQKILHEVTSYNIEQEKKHPDLAINVSDITKNYYAFCLCMTDDEMLASMSHLDHLIDFLQAESLQKNSDVFRSLYQSAVKLNNEIVEQYKTLCHIEELSTSDLVEFFSGVIKSLKAFNGQIKCGDVSLNTKVTLFFDAITSCLEQFVQHCYLLNETFEGELNELRNSFLSSKNNDIFVNKPTLDLSGLVNNTIVWLHQTDEETGYLENQHTLATLFSGLLSEYEKNCSTLTARASAQAYELSSQAVFAVTSVVSRFSFWGSAETVAPSVEQPRVQTTLESLKQVESEINNAKTPDQLSAAINKLLGISEVETRDLKNKFFTEIIHQFSREFSDLAVSEQINNPRFAEYLRAQPGKQIPELEIVSAVSLFRSAMVLDSDDGDFCVVGPSPSGRSQERLTGSAGTLGLQSRSSPLGAEKETSSTQFLHRR